MGAPVLAGWRRCPFDLAFFQGKADNDPRVLLQPGFPGETGRPGKCQQGCRRRFRTAKPRRGVTAGGPEEGGPGGAPARFSKMLEGVWCRNPPGPAEPASGGREYVPAFKGLSGRGWHEARAGGFFYDSAQGGSGCVALLPGIMIGGGKRISRGDPLGGGLGRVNPIPRPAGGIPSKPGWRGPRPRRGRAPARPNLLQFTHGLRGGVGTAERLAPKKPVKSVMYVGPGPGKIVEEGRGRFVLPPRDPSTKAILNYGDGSLGGLGITRGWASAGGRPGGRRAGNGPSRGEMGPQILPPPCARPGRPGSGFPPVFCQLGASCAWGQGRQQRTQLARRKKKNSGPGCHTRPCWWKGGRARLLGPLGPGAAWDICEGRGLSPLRRGGGSTQQKAISGI